MPARYFFDEENSTLLPRALVTQPGQGARILKLSEFQTGYFARYLNSDPPRWRYVTSVAYVFRQPKGARAFMSWMTDTGFAHARGRITRVDLGEQAWMHTSPSSEIGTSILWHSGRVFALVTCSHMSRHETLALGQARKQQRRIAAELR